MSLVLGILVVLVAAACAQSNTTTNGTSGTGGGATSTVPVAGVSGIIRDWSESTHAVPVTFAAQEKPCAGCHDGRGFAQGISDPASLNATAPFGPYVVATDCRACHTGKGADYLRSGTVTTPTEPSAIKAGTGAVCIACHRDRSKASVSQKPGAPHASAQAPVYLAYGGIRQPGFNYGSTVKHTQVADMCVHCHMSDVNGVPTHTFMPPKDPAKICGQCHQGVTTYNRQASNDYDGNGKVQGIQTEVTGLLGELNQATARAVGGDTLLQNEGQIVFKNNGATMTVTMPDKVYQAAYNWALVANDRSRGVHNPQFTVNLLQESYFVLTGHAVPNAKPFPGSTLSSGTATGTPSGGASGTATGTTGATGTSGTP